MHYEFYRHYQQLQPHLQKMFLWSPPMGTYDDAWQWMWSSLMAGNLGIVSGIGRYYRVGRPSVEGTSILTYPHRWAALPSIEGEFFPSVVAHTLVVTMNNLSAWQVFIPEEVVVSLVILL